MDPWQDNRIQFPRLIAEIVAAQSLDIETIAASMDLDVENVEELLNRADVEWEAIKRKQRRSGRK